MAMAGIPELPTGTVTFLFTDIEGSTRLLQQLGSGYTELLEQHREILRSACRARGGVEFGTEGDAHFVAFPSATEALGAAVDAQRGLAAHPWPGPGRIRVRMGLHTGEGTVVGDSYVGLDVHRAARIAAAGHGGQVLLSAATTELAGAALPDGVRLLDLGRHRLKDLEQPEHLSQLVIAGLQADFPALRSTDARPNNLPVELTTFVGREAELVSAMELLRTNRLVTLTGPGGTGKTRLALHVASHALHHFESGVFLVPLASVADPSLVSSTIAQALDVQEMGERPILDLLKQHVEPLEMLLVLDNFEQILPAAPVVTELLLAAPRLKVLVTSQAVLHVVGEQEFPVAPLALPDPRHLPELHALSQYDAVALFIQRARSVNPTFSVTNQNAPAVAEICARLDGLPLAIELAAARSKLLAPDALLKRLEHSLTILRGAREMPARQQTLHGAIAWSYDLLEPEEQTVFRRLGVFVRGWTLEGAEAVADLNGDLSVEVFDTLEALVDKSLVRAEPQSVSETRFSMLQTIREFALEELTSSGEQPAVARVHAARFLALAEEAEPHLTGEQRVAWLDRLEREHDNLRAALRFSIDAGEASAALRLSGALWRFWHFRGHLSEGRAWLAEALAMPGAREQTGFRAKALQGMAGLAYWQRDYQASSAAYEEALAQCRETGDPAEVATALYNLAFSLGAQWETERPRALLAESRDLYEQAGNHGGVAYTGLLLAVIEQLDESWDVSRSVVDESIATFRDLGDRWGLGNVLGIAARIDRERGDFDLARARLGESLSLFHEAGDVAGTAMLLGAMAATAADMGDGEAAATFAGTWAALEEQVGGGAPEALRAFEDPVPPARRLLGERAFTSAWERGRAMSVDDAVRSALDWAAAVSVSTPLPGK
jgi:predicted ATPase/class 3 adenylate cyclase